MRVIIAGGGSVGRFIAEELHELGHDVTIIDNDRDVVARAAARRGAGRACSWYEGDACEIPALADVGMADADVVAAVTGDDEDNLVISLLSKQEFGVPRVVARVNNPKNEWMFNEVWGVDVSVSTPHLLTALVEEAVTVGSFIRLLSFEGGRARLAEVRLAEGTPVDGKTIEDLGVPRDATVVAVLRKDRLIVPRGDTMLRAGDEVIVLVTSESEDEVKRLLTGVAHGPAMKLLFVGGTSFVGRHAVEAAVAAGHDVTVFHRGRTNDDLLAGAIEHRHGDRNSPDYSALADDTLWDAVVDVSAYVPRHVHQLADAVGGRAGHYVHISSISAYDDGLITPDEDSPAARSTWPTPAIEEITDETYGPLKAMCERAGRKRFGDDRTAIIRPTYVAGPHDPTDRFTYWARRMGRGGDVAIVGPGAPLQIVDGRDLGAFMVGCAETGAAGSFDGVGPWAPVEEFLAEITPAGVEARLVDVGGAAVEAAGTPLPMLSAEPEPAAFMSRPGERARARRTGRRARSPTRRRRRVPWDDDRGLPELKNAPSPEAEAELIATVAETGSFPGDTRPPLPPRWRRRRDAGMANKYNAAELAANAQHLEGLAKAARSNMLSRTTEKATRLGAEGERLGREARAAEAAARRGRQAGERSISTRRPATTPRPTPWSSRPLPPQLATTRKVLVTPKSSARMPPSSAKAPRSLGERRASPPRTPSGWPTRRPGCAPGSTRSTPSSPTWEAGCPWPSSPWTTSNGTPRRPARWPTPCARPTTCRPSRRRRRPVATMPRQPSSASGPPSSATTPTCGQPYAAILRSPWTTPSSRTSASRWLLATSRCRCPSSSIPMR